MQTVFNRRNICRIKNRTDVDTHNTNKSAGNRKKLKIEQNLLLEISLINKITLLYKTLWYYSLFIVFGYDDALDRQIYKLN